MYRVPIQLSWRGVNVLLLTTTTVLFACDGHFTAFTPLQLRELGLDDVEVGVWTGLLVGITMATSLPFGPFWGVLAERFSHRTILLRTFAFEALALLLAAWAPDLPWLVAARAAIGFSYGAGGVVTATQALLTPPRHVGRAVALVQVSLPISASLGPPIGAIAIPIVGMRGLLVIDAVAVLLAGLVLGLLVPDPERSDHTGSVMERMRDVCQMAWSAPPVRWNLANQFLVRAGQGTVDSYLAVRITQAAADPALAIGWILGAYGAFTTLVSWFVGRIADRHDIVKIYAYGMLLAAIATVGIAASPWLWAIAIFALIRAIPTALARPLLFAHLARVVPTANQTAVFGLFPTVGNLGGLIFPVLAAGAVSYGVWAAFAIGAVGYCTSFAAGVKLDRTGGADPKPEPEAWPAPD